MFKYSGGRFGSLSKGAVREDLFLSTGKTKNAPPGRLTPPDEAA
jgi:hypothetical protein